MRVLQLQLNDQVIADRDLAPFSSSRIMSRPFWRLCGDVIVGCVRTHALKVVAPARFVT